MTTIVYKDGILACDSQVTTNSEVIIGYCNKIQEFDNEVICGSGSTTAIKQFIDWHRRGDDPEKKPTLLGDGCVCFVIDKKTLELKRYCDCWYDSIGASFYVTGSGMEIAIGALEMGATAEEAIKAACKYDTGTGGEVHVLDLNKTKVENDTN